MDSIPFLKCPIVQMSKLFPWHAATAITVVCFRALVQSSDQVTCPRPTYSDLLSAGLAHQPDETTHSLSFSSCTQWVDVAVTLSAAVVQQLPQLKVHLLFVHSSQWRTENEAREETSQSGVNLFDRNILFCSLPDLQCQTPPHCSSDPSCAF